MAVLVVLTLVVGGGNLWASWDYVHAYTAGQDRLQAAQQQQGAAIEHKLCTTLNRLAALQPPPGNAAANPSRAYEQGEHAILSQLGPDVGCPPAAAKGGR